MYKLANDIVHLNYGPEWLALVMRDAAQLKTPCITTFHGMLTQAAQTAMFSGRYRDEPVVSISKAQRRPLPDLNYVDTVYNGVDTRRLTFNETPDPDGHLVFLGRIAPDKGPHDAIDIALRTGRRLVMAAKIDPNPVDEQYWKDIVKPLVDKHRSIEFIGEVNDLEKDRLLGRATGALAPVAPTWFEPFGLGNGEANACGTPVVSANHGAIPEVIMHGETGWLFPTKDEMVACINDGRLEQLSRLACRQRVERMFSYEVMAAGYEVAFHKVIAT